MDTQSSTAECRAGSLSVQPTSEPMSLIPGTPLDEATSPFLDQGEEEPVLPFLFVDIKQEEWDEAYGQFELVQTETKPPMDSLPEADEHGQLHGELIPKQEPDDLQSLPEPQEVLLPSVWGRSGSARGTQHCGRGRGSRGSHSRACESHAAAPIRDTQELPNGTRPQQMVRRCKLCTCCEPPDKLPISRTAEHTAAASTSCTATAAPHPWTGTSQPNREIADTNHLVSNSPSVGVPNTSVVPATSEGMSVKVEEPTDEDDRLEKTGVDDLQSGAEMEHDYGDSRVARTKGRLGKHRCWQCPAVLQTYEKLDQHTAEQHPGTTPNHCTDCGKSFLSREYLKIHKHKHINLRAYKCTACGKGFMQPQTLRQHELAVHKHMKPHPCSKCGRHFADHSNLRRHMLTHSETRAFLCLECGARFRLLQQLQVHRRQHTGERPYICETCGLSYADHTTLRRHRQKHTGEVSFICNTCGKSFDRKYRLIDHVQRHLGLSTPVR